ncbi:MAG: hypothetical protein JXX29_00310 [Deltaproteobacteria bacterium]|nr:hypothetical protein [Deltaproteobacteria bacterium]MBN2670078.1 hypothetical protein [Deltaproteobacteria bacterium]
MIRHYLPAIVFSIVAFTLILQSNAAEAERPDDILIIANKSIKTDSISLTDAKRIFLKQKTSLNGERITPIHAKSNSPLRKQFGEKVLGKSPSEEKSYWEDQKIKSGLRPPAELSNTMRAIFSLKNGISYCYRKDFTPGTAKILLVL